MEESSIGNEELLRMVLTGANQRIIKSNPIGGSDRYYEDTGNWGWGTDENPFEFPEIIVTPDGNSWDEDWANDWNSNNNWWDSNDDWWNSNDDFIQGGGGGSVSNDAETSNTAQLVTDTIMNSINNGTAIVFQMEDSKTYKLASLSAFVSNVPALQAEILSIVSHNDAFLKQCSNLLGDFALAANIPFTVIGVADGDVSVSDYLNVFSTVTGLIGKCCGTTPIGFAFDGLSFVLSIAALCVSGNESNSSTSNY